MSSIRKALDLGIRFIINDPDFVLQIKEGESGRLQLWINGELSPAMVSLFRKHITISVKQYGLWLEYTTGLSDLVFVDKTNLV